MTSSPMTALNKQALREAANAANIASWGKWESYKPHKGARGYEVKVGAKTVAQHCLKVDSAFIAAANPPTVLALLDELEAAEKRIEEEICRANREHHRGFMMACNHLKEHANVHYADAAEMEIAALRQRIAELEVRAFKVEMPESFYPDGDIDAPLAVDELEVIAAIVEAGGKPVAFCKRCDREIDLTHRPDGSHYCHAPAACIGVKGE